MYSPQARWRRVRLAAWVAAIVGLGVVVIAGGQRSPTDPADGKMIQGKSAAVASERSTLRVGTFNIHGGIGKDGRASLDRTAAELGGFDIIGLNEVGGADLFNWRDQAERLGQKSGMNWLFAPSERRWWRDDWGNALLTNLSVDQWQRAPLPGSRPKGLRNYVVVLLKHRAVSWAVLITHLDPSPDREAQMREVCDRFLALPEPAILMGDLNARIDHPRIRQLLASNGVVDALGTSSLSHIDWILVRGCRVVDAGLRPTVASDHSLCWAALAPLSATATP